MEKNRLNLLITQTYAVSAVWVLPQILSGVLYPYQSMVQNTRSPQTLLANTVLIPSVH